MLRNHEVNSISIIKNTVNHSTHIIKNRTHDDEIIFDSTYRNYFVNPVIQRLYDVLTINRK